MPSYIGGALHYSYLLLNRLVSGCPRERRAVADLQFGRGSHSSSSSRHGNRSASLGAPLVDQSATLPSHPSNTLHASSAVSPVWRSSPPVPTRTLLDPPSPWSLLASTSASRVVASRSSATPTLNPSRRAQLSSRTVRWWTPTSSYAALASCSSSPSWHQRSTLVLGTPRGTGPSTDTSCR